MKTSAVLIGAFFVTTLSFAAPADANRDAFLKRQAYAEMQRVTGQIDVLQASHEELTERVRRMEGGSSELGGVKADVAALKAEIENLRREMNRMHQEIVADVTKKVTEIVKANQAAAPARQSTAAPVTTAGCKTYVVQSGDTLSLIAQAFGTTVAKIKEQNGLKRDFLRVGQKLLVPKN